jgi:single-strand DNA-binding protein
MNGFNRLTIVGNLGSEPTIRTSKEGHTFTRLSVATNRAHKDEERNKKGTTEWFTVNVWGRLGDTCAKYLAKGQGVYIEGYLSSYSILKEDDKKEYRLAINALKVEFLQKPLGSVISTEVNSPPIQ